jgi:predicted NAD/FAD-binding protein
VVALDGSSENFDEVVIAVHSDVALGLLADPSPVEAEVLGAIPYQRNSAVLHTDTSLMPRRRSAWASWNYHLVERPTGRTTVTYYMNRLQSLVADRDYLVTLNLSEAIDPEAVIRRIDYAHPIYTPEGMAAQQRWAEVSGGQRTHYCGAYWRWGFHEDGVWSALRVSEQLGGRGPLPRADGVTPMEQPAERASEALAAAA